MPIEVALEGFSIIVQDFAICIYLGTMVLWLQPWIYGLWSTRTKARAMVIAHVYNLKLMVQ